MRIWLSCFFVLFALAELYQWAKHFSLPLPIYILGGAFLAIASNYNKQFGSFFINSSAEPPVIDSDNPIDDNHLNQSQYISVSGAQATEHQPLDTTKSK